MNPARIFLTGEPGCGKTTAIIRITELLVGQGMKVGGIISGEICRSGVRVGFKLEDIMTHETGILAHMDQAEGPRIGKYRVNLSDIERIGASAIDRAIRGADVIVVDEIGPMELNSNPFIMAVKTALSSTRPFLATIHKRASHNLVTAIKSNSQYAILDVNLHNRNQMPQQIARMIELQE
jgi:nucleoside-triphosphatase